MSQNDSESDIWEYKSLRKVKKQDALASNKKRGQKKKPVTVINGSTSSSNNSSFRGKIRTRGKPKAETCDKIEELLKDQGQQDKRSGALTSHTEDAAPVEYGPRSGSSEKEQPLADSEEFCPGCQMPFSILLVQSQRWHVSECLDVIGVDREECPDGLKCSSTIPSHYRKYSHFLLAHSRATNDRTGLSTDGTQENVTGDFSPSSQSPSSSQSASPSLSQGGLGQKSSPTCTNAFLLLKSPAPVDIKKKKGMSPVAKRQRTTLLEQGGGATRPLRETGSASRRLQEDQKQADTSSPLRSVLPSPPSSSSDSDEISYSPISAPPIGKEILSASMSPSYSSVTGGGEGAGDEGSVMLYSDDELLAEFLTQAELESSHQPGHRTAAVNSEHMQACFSSLSPRAYGLNDDRAASGSSVTPGSEVNEEPTRCASSGLPSDKPAGDSATITSLAPPGDELNEGSAPSAVCPFSGLEQERGAAAVGDHAHANDTRPQLQSPQSLVLERLRERLCGSGEATGADPDTSAGDPTQDDAMPAVTRSSALRPRESTTPKKARGRTGASAPRGLKQTDIGVFFGLKPLKPRAGDAAAAATKKEDPAHNATAAGGDAGGARPAANGRRRKRKATSSAGEPPVPGAADGDSTQVPRAESGQRGAGRKRWRRRTEEGSETVRRCPFYKKIPGTPFAVDAFQYGAIDGVSAYFLTHFHSDHYNGLRKGSSLPIYCNQITGNLVKTKLRVEEQYVHVLPMNTECIVEGVRITLLDANHCPGAAMLLLVLRDGQTVLHTGDFRADPSMESYPALQRCRVQTLYLDTTYCSPEYTFPTQQEAVTFAVSRAFEQVSLNPRTLVVCGTYSVGKEKVFLAIAEVLGCKAGLSRDKYNTMCCLESDRIRQLVSTDWKAAQVHVLPMMQLSFKNLEAHLSKFSAKYDQVLAFKPTGWTYSGQAQSVEDIQPEIRGNVSIYGIPYSEHSSYLEMKRFVQWLRPLKIIPTVSVGSWASRKAMERLFSEWRTESPGGWANGAAAN